MAVSRFKSDVWTVSPYFLAGVCFLGSFSRLTHGKYTPHWYAFQEYHSPDDGSPIANIVPYIDAIVGTLLLFRRTRFGAAILANIFLCSGLGVQIRAGKKVIADIALCALSIIALVGSTK